MSDPTLSPVRRRIIRKRLLAAIFVVGIGALMFYLGMVRPPTQKHLKLALVTWTQDPFWEPFIRGAQHYADQSNVELIVVRSEPTVDAQNQHIHALLDSGVDGMAISPNDATAQLAVLDEVAAKVPLVTFDTDAPQSKRRRFVGIDNYAAGRVCADEMREALPDGGPILISVGSATMQHGRDRRQGVIDGLLERGFDRNRTPDPLDAPIKGTKYTIVATVTDGADPAKAVAVITDALQAHPEVKGVVGLFSYSAPAALEAMKKIGRAGQLQVVGFDDADQTQAAIQAGSIHSSILQDTPRAGYESIEVLANEVRGIGPGPAEQSPLVNVDINVLTAKNLASLRASGAIRQPATATSTGP
jgi:ribose transport system substrate-binding protein